MKLVTKPGDVHFVEFAQSQRSQYPYLITSWNIGEVSSPQGAEAIQQCKKQNVQQIKRSQRRLFCARERQYRKAFNFIPGL